jgi:hypothetical protein
LGEEIGKRLGVSLSSLWRWIDDASKQILKQSNKKIMTIEKKPQDLSLQERLHHITSCFSLGEEVLKATMHYLFVAKQGDHKIMFEWLNNFDKLPSYEYKV